MRTVKEWLRQEWLSIAIGLSGLALLLSAKPLEELLVEHHPKTSGILSHVMEELGGVLVVGMLVRVALEEGYQERFLGSVSKEVKESIDRVSREAVKPLSSQIDSAAQSIAILDKTLSSASTQINQLSSALTYKVIQNLQPEFRKVLEDRVLNSPFVRPEFGLVITLSPYGLQGGTVFGDLVIVGIKTAYVIKNQKESNADFNCVFWLDDMIRRSGHRECEYTRFTYGKVDKHGATHFYPPADLLALERDGFISLDKSALRLSFEIQDIEPGASYAVAVEGRTVMRANDVLIWSMATLTNRLDMKILLEHGLTLNDLDVVTRALHHAEAEVNVVSEREIQVKLDQVFLPYQGIEVRWMKKTPNQQDQ